MSIVVVLSNRLAIESVVADLYRLRGFHFFGGVNIGGLDRYSFSFLKA